MSREFLSALLKALRELHGGLSLREVIDRLPDDLSARERATLERRLSREVL